ncbi:MAG TPA: histidine phosphatase family protein, partial [Solirubrobacterales bacterium]|nr:histidine phosphatase family protein [Solirubrobacterales bacterium]
MSEPGGPPPEPSAAAEPPKPPSGTTGPGRPVVWLARHGETEWSRTLRHTGRTDLPLTAEGEREARELREPLAAVGFDRVLCSPLSRARETCELA